jgi:hypothetical protein
MTSLGRAVRLLPILALFVFAPSCGGFFPPQGSIQSITVSPSAIILKVGDTPPDTYTLSSSSTTVSGTTADDTATATWNSSAHTVVTVASGVVTAVGSSGGTATVTAVDGGATSNTVNVLTYSVATPQSLSVFCDGILSGGTAAPNTYKCHAFLGASSTFPEVTNFVSWTSNSVTSATVGTTGLVTVLSIAIPTSVTITATANVGASAPATPSTIVGSIQFTAD